MSAMILLWTLGHFSTALAVDPTVATIAAKEIASPEVQAAATLAEPIAQEASAIKHLADAGNEALDPVLFTGHTFLLVPQYARPVRAVWTVATTPVRIFHPAKAAQDLARVPGDLWAPFEATGKILLDTPRLLGPVRALSSVGEFAAASCRSARSLPAGEDGLLLSPTAELR
jgi:hypothetical protein